MYNTITVITTIPLLLLLSSGLAARDGRRRARGLPMKEGKLYINFYSIRNNT